MYFALLSNLKLCMAPLVRLHCSVFQPINTVREKGVLPVYPHPRLIESAIGIGSSGRRGAYLILLKKQKCRGVSTKRQVEFRSKNCQTLPTFTSSRVDREQPRLRLRCRRQSARVEVGSMVKFETSPCNSPPMTWGCF